LTRSNKNRKNERGKTSCSFIRWTSYWHFR